jgi:hypothetical protein
LKKKITWDQFKDLFKQKYGEARDFELAAEQEKKIEEQIKPNVR